MNFIINCPSCSNNLRFPLDKGKIKVTCQCGYSFIADPDDTKLYRRGHFDLKGKSSKKKEQNKLNFDHLISNLVEKIYNFKYKLQNFKLLPAAEQKKLILYLILFLIAIILLVFLINFSGSIQSEKIII